MENWEAGNQEVEGRETESWEAGSQEAGGRREKVGAGAGQEAGGAGDGEMLFCGFGHKTEGEIFLSEQSFGRYFE